MMLAVCRNRRQRLIDREGMFDGGRGLVMGIVEFEVEGWFAIDRTRMYDHKSWVALSP